MLGLSGSQKIISYSDISASNIFYFLIISAPIIWYIYWHLSKRHMIELAKKFPGPQGYPLIGNFLELAGSSCDIFKHLYSYSFQYDIGRAWLGPKLVIIITDPRDIEIILSSHVHIDKASEYRFFQPWLGNGILISTGPAWRTQRKLIAPTFHLNVLKGFVDLFNTNSRQTVDKLRKECGKTFDCHDYMSEATVEILLETAMGVNKKVQGKAGYDYAMAVMKMCDIIHLRHTKFWLRPDWLFNLTKHGKIQKTLLNTIHSFTRKVLKSKKATLARGAPGSTLQVYKETAPEESTGLENEEPTESPEGSVVFGQSVGIKDDLDTYDNDVGEKKRMAFLDLMFEASQGGTIINDEEIKEQVDTIMFEGHDTTAAASSFFLCLMGLHPEIQAKVHNEMDTIFGKSQRSATFNDTLEMKYLERCLLETLRLYPPVPIIGREIKEDVKLASGDYTIPAGSALAIATFRTHRRPDIYPNPDVYDPDNFLPQRTASRHYYSFIPFSAGPRSCVGRKYAMLKLKILLSTIMRNFVVESYIPESDFQLQGDIILKRGDGFKIRLEPRNAN
ncbi:hypothetical protein RI129_007522 [Pyrocoelia pectoralis]|uniref:Cytochrome P450 n=1 Tax=Pyrocoelia pectoralis TaxID=417401 RepID=A0AAN7V9U4_9COLE